MRRIAVLVSLLIVATGCTESDSSSGMTVTVEDLGIDAEQPIDAARDMQVVIVEDAVARDVSVDAQTDGSIDLGAPEPDMFIPTACADEIDNDSDGLIDYPLDPGCTSSADDNELDPDNWACEDGLDNDEDGLTDHPDDPGCADPADVNEDNVCDDMHDFVDVTGKTRIESDTTGRMGYRNVCRNNNAPEAVYLVTIRDSIRRLRVDTKGSSFDTLLAVWRACDDPQSEIVCNDDISFRERASEIILETPSPGDYFILVDGHGESAGPFVLNINGDLGPGEPCREGSWISCGVGGICSNGQCEFAQCADGMDNDGDGTLDYPNDPGCEDASDNDETTPIPRPLCSDGIDNDFDGRSDYPEDPDCEAASDNDESSPPACSDGLDNDQDGLIDLNDPGCNDDPNRGSEFNSPACRNGLDDDLDGLIDFPADPGCTERNDQDETDPDVPAACSDGLDNDEDGLTDYPADAISCLYAADETEDDPCMRLMPREITGLARTRGNTDDEPNDFTGSCQQPSSGEDVLLWRVAEDRPLQNLIIDTRDSTYDTLLHVRTGCTPDTEIACDDDGGPGFASRVELGPQAPGTELLIFVDGNTGQSGIWRMRISAQLAAGANCGGRGDYVCGDGLSCEETPDGERCVRAICDDGLDNDEDGLIDHPFDPGCASASDDDETDPAVAPVCSNGIDDDADGLIDFGSDPNCSSAADDFEGADCADGIDNDGDGNTDYDRDGNGTPGPNRDVECACANDPSEEDQPDCSDACDNDNDGLIDLADPGCRGDPLRNTEFNVPQCRDQLDNNEDGRRDYPDDPSCRFENAPLEVDLEVPPACADGLDNDGDGLTDYPEDEGCVAAGDNDEQPTCESDLPVFPITGVAVGNTGDGLAEHAGACGFDSGAPEMIYRVRAPYPGLVVATTLGSSFNTILYARSVCTPETVCPEPEPEPNPDAGVGDMGIADGGVPDAAPVNDAAPIADAQPVQDAGVPPEDANIADAARGPVDGSPAADSGLPDQNLADAQSPADAAIADAGIMQPADAAGNNDPGDEPCFPEISQVACNDNAIGFFSRVGFNWLGGDFFLFVDGFNRDFGAYQVNLEIIYPRNGQCGPELLDYARCEEGTECRLDVGLGYSVCR